MSSIENLNNSMVGISQALNIINGSILDESINTISAYFLSNEKFNMKSTLLDLFSNDNINEICSIQSGNCISVNPDLIEEHFSVKIFEDDFITNLNRKSRKLYFNSINCKIKAKKDANKSENENLDSFSIKKMVII